MVDRIKAGKENNNKKTHQSFVLGDTIESTTKRIWVWCKDHPEQKDTVLILLDTEGLGDIEKKVTTKLLSYIYCQEPKQLEVSKPVNGSMFATLARNYVDALAKGAVPDVDDAFASVAKIENQRVKEECMNMFRSKMKGLQLPQPSKLLDTHFTDTRWTALEYMRTKAIKDVANVVERKAQMEMDLFWQQFQRQNEGELVKHCENVLFGLESIRNLLARLQTEGYNVLGGHKKFKRDVETARQQYEQAFCDYEPREGQAL
ncbi:guanylate-binding protein 5-like [Mya arenaria]|uniref:guanylate-binding protein 5-like n=1 Tax=Mya arenaria TaxID=6604 RepID=UPI0022E8F9FD|nr:guanylate-binding protein 5-like [Mya arenaria]